MPESGEWFSPRTRPEMLTSDDPPIQTEKPELVQILPGPATAVGRATAPLRRLVEFVPSIGRRIVRVDDEPSRWQLIGMWTTGSAIVAATGLAVAAVLGGAPPALTQPFERLAVLPGIVGPQSPPDEASPTSSDGKPAARHEASGTSRHSSGSSSGYSGYGYSGGSSGGSSATVVYPEDLVPGRAAVPGVSSAGAPSASGSTGTSAGAPTGGQTGGTQAPPPTGGGTTAPAPDPTTAPPADPPPVTDPTEEPTDPGTAPTDPTPPTEEPTDPPPAVDPTPVDPSPADPTPESPPDQTPADDPPPAEPTQDEPVDSPAPTPETSASTPETPPATP
jgi:hypothetical protein